MKTQEDSEGPIWKEEVRDLLKRQVLFSRDILSLVSQNFELKEELATKNKQIKLIGQKVNKLQTLINKKRISEAVKKEKN